MKSAKKNVTIQTENAKKQEKHDSTVTFDLPEPINLAITVEFSDHDIGDDLAKAIGYYLVSQSEIKS